MKDGRTRLAHKAEAVVAVTVQGAEAGDTKTMDKTLRMALEEVSAVQPGAEVKEVVADKGYHSTKIALDLKQQGLRSYVSEPDRKGRRRWKGRVDAQRAVYGNRPAHSWRARPTVAAPAERTGGTTVCPSVRNRRAASDLRPGPSQCAQTAAGARVRIQSGPLDGAS